jgi:undecaprenyl-diphosphatase
MLAATGLELVKNRSALQGNMSILAIGFVVSFITAIIAIKSFLGYIKNRDFSHFGWYRIALAVVFYIAFLR